MFGYILNKRSKGDNWLLVKGGIMTTIGEFKGNKMIKLATDENDKYPFSFGVRKAKIILANIEDIKKFVEQYDEK